ncbi:hypothetical protein HK102_000864 [Quaeritorhiza haematococci]|nr:hypothetical protein HK102_000864 [Quaeritorhiza haematococci]
MSLEVANHEYKGRCFKSNKKIHKGEVLIRCKPYAAISDTAKRLNTCTRCFSPIPSLFHNDSEPSHTHRTVQCQNRCGLVFYCSPECEAADWTNFHALECDFFKSDRDYGDFAVTPCLSHTDRTDSALDLVERAARDTSASGTNTNRLTRVMDGKDGSQDQYKQLQLTVPDYVQDFTWMIARVLCRMAKEISTGRTSDHPLAGAVKEVEGSALSGPEQTYQDVWKLCSNISCFSDESMKTFYIAAHRLAEFIVRKLIPEIPNLNVDDFILATEKEIEDCRQRLKEVGEEDDEVIAFKFGLDPPTCNRLISSLIALIAKEECNSFGLYKFPSSHPDCLGHRMESYGLGLFTQVGFFNHACTPNVGHIWRKSELIFYALTDIDPREEAVLSYVGLDEEVRRVEWTGEEYRVGERRRKRWCIGTGGATLL